jgi:hypothetical protein
VPRQDYVPPFALLASQLTHEQPSDADIANVRAHLAAGGWPLAEPPR